MSEGGAAKKPKLSFSQGEEKVDWKKRKAEAKEAKRQRKEAKVIKQLEKQKQQEQEDAKEKAPQPSQNYKGRPYTVSVALPGSVLDNAQSTELRTYLAGQIARACAVFCVDEIIIFDEEGDDVKSVEGEFKGVGKKGQACIQLARILQYLECPQYLRKWFFPKHQDLQYAGLLNPLDSPHHMRIDEESEYREGVVLDRPTKPGKGSLVNCGMRKDVQIDKQLQAGLRVTVRLNKTQNTGISRLNKGVVVAPHVPRTEGGLYWGYSVRLASSLSNVFTEGPYKEGYDLTIGTSERGSNIDQTTLSPFRGGGDTGPPKKKSKRKQKQSTGKGFSEKKPTPKPLQKPSSSTAASKGPSITEQNAPKAKIANVATVAKTQNSKGAKVESNFSTVDVLRKRLHEKIEEARGQGTPKNPLSEEVQAKRAKRKLERERKKRKRKEFRMKKLAEKAGTEQQQEIKQEEAPAPVPTAGKRDETAIIFNKVETVEEGYVDKIQKKMEKKKNVKGKLTPLTGKNYKQLLSRVEARKAKLEKLRETDKGKAREMEEKMKWTNVLYKAEGLKIKDDENMLRTALKRKEKMRSQRKKRWDERSQNVVEKIQRRQDKRRRNIQKCKQGKMEKKKERARKKGRVLPEDLKKAAL